MNNKNFEDIFSTEIPEEIEQLIKGLELDLADREKLGASLLIIGYSYFIYASNTDIFKILNEEAENITSPYLLLFIGEVIVVTGLIVLWSVAIGRFNEKDFENKFKSSDTNTSPYKRLANAYALSVIANIERVIVLNELYLKDINGLGFI